MLRSLIGTSDTGKVGQLAGARQLVKPLRVARLANLNRRIDVDLDKFIGLDEITRRKAAIARPF